MKSTRALHFSARNIHQYLLIPGDRHDLYIIFPFSLSVWNNQEQSQDTTAEFWKADIGKCF